MAQSGRKGFANLGTFGIRNKMTLKSALQDVKETTLAAVSGLLGKLAYLASLRRAQGRYEHWGMELVHGPESAERALKTAHAEVLAGVLRTPVASLVEDLEESSRAARGCGSCLRRGDAQTDRGFAARRAPDSPAASHLNSVLLALSSLEKHRGRATRSIS
jgi:hypothetical protein